ncbi:MAG: YbaL family putative K(+) efflux transporter [Amaricoccus sp.]
MHDTPLIATLVAGFVLAFLFGALAQRLRLSPLVGYLLAGVAIGPATPGYVADMHLAPELAEIGVILLMFGVGLHFSLRDLLSVRTIAIPGAIGQIVLATLLGMALAWWIGWPVATGLVFGLALSVASTVVLLRALQDRHLLDTDRGRIAVGWLIVEDLAMVLTLVLLPVVAGAMASGNATIGSVLVPLAVTLAKVGVFVALMLAGGRRLIPWVLHRVAGTGSRELFTLAVLAVSLGIAFGAAQIFGVSFALGAFFAGMVLAESELSHRAAEDSLPLRDAFAVLFFVSVGMLFDPAILVRMPLAVAATVAVIVVGKAVVAYVIVRLFGLSRSTALTVSVSLAQIGEFSFILASLGVTLGLMVPEAQDLVLAGAILSIVINPLLFSVLDRMRRPQPTATSGAASGEETLVPTGLSGHTVIAGYGVVGQHLAEALTADARPFVVVDDRPERTAPLRLAGREAITANATHAEVLAAAGIDRARNLLVAIPNVFEAGQVTERARAANAALHICARAETEGGADHLREHGADQVIVGRAEIAAAMIKDAFGADTTLPSASGEARAGGPDGVVQPAPAG